MDIRTFQPGDEAAQASIYNAAAASMSGFKPATTHEVKRRTQARDFDPGMRFFAIDNGQPVGYCYFSANGRISYPWCQPGSEAATEPLFQRALNTMKERGMPLAFAAYRRDWPTVCNFFLEHGFQKARDMVNFVQEIVDMPTVPARPSSPLTPLRREDIPAVFELGEGVLRVQSPKELEDYLFANPYFSADCLFALRAKTDNKPVAVGIVIIDGNYADPRTLDAMMPCFRLGAFGTENMQSKRISGMFSLLARPDGNFLSLAQDLLGHAVFRSQDRDDFEALAAQVPSDVPHLLRFYQQNFRTQGSFPVYERKL